MGKQTVSQAINGPKEGAEKYRINLKDEELNTEDANLKKWSNMKDIDYRITIIKRTNKCICLKIIGLLIIGENLFWHLVGKVLELKMDYEHKCEVEKRYQIQMYHI